MAFHHLEMDLDRPGHILWQNKDRTVTLLDGPRSIADAQTLDGSAGAHEILSSKPLQVPFVSPEPRSSAARESVRREGADDEIDRLHRALLNDALSEVRARHGGPWLLPRHYVDSSISTRKRKFKSNDEPKHKDEPASGSQSRDGPGRVSALLSEIMKAPGSVKWELLPVEPLLEIDHGLSNGEPMSVVDVPFVWNGHSSQARLKIGEIEDDTFLLPPHSTFMIGDCMDSKHISTFHNAVHDLAYGLETERRFDFILMDPPWPNRSVSRKRDSYKTPSLRQVMQMLCLMDLDRLMADGCLVSIWVTNKPAIREEIVGENGLFCSWGVQLVEEWLWLKVTAGGEPVMDLSSTWRKPYEVLLLGRKRRTPLAYEDQHGPKRRVLVSVPDLHSRKPCLRRLIEPMMPDGMKYRALEVFARSLVAGWCSWGDECIKFNWEKDWLPAQGSTSDTVTKASIENAPRAAHQILDEAAPG